LPPLLADTPAAHRETATQTQERAFPMEQGIATYIISIGTSGFGACVQKNDLVDYVRRDKQHPLWDHNLYRTLNIAITKAADVEHLSRHVHRGFKVFRHILCIVCNLPKPDLLHTMQRGIFDHPQKWILHVMMMPERLDKYNALRLSVPCYHDLTPNTHSYEELSQWNGKEMKEMTRYLLGVVTQSLQGGNPVQSPYSIAL
jgi:hypothetical protein